jgi:hypothetical protein
LVISVKKLQVTPKYMYQTLDICRSECLLAVMYGERQNSNTKCIEVQLYINSAFDQALLSTLKTSLKHSAETHIYVPSCGLPIFINFPIPLLLQNLIPVTISDTVSLYCIITSLKCVPVNYNFYMRPRH